jgi:hypothetical protein
MSGTPAPASFDRGGLERWFWCGGSIFAAGFFAAGSVGLVGSTVVEGAEAYEGGVAVEAVVAVVDVEVGVTVEIEVTEVAALGGGGGMEAVEAGLGLVGTGAGVSRAGSALDAGAGCFVRLDFDGPGAAGLEAVSDFGAAGAGAAALTTGPATFFAGKVVLAKGCLAVAGGATGRADFLPAAFEGSLASLASSGSSSSSSASIKVSVLLSAGFVEACGLPTTGAKRWAPAPAPWAPTSLPVDDWELCRRGSTGRFLTAISRLVGVTVTCFFFGAGGGFDDPACCDCVGSDVCAVAAVLPEDTSLSMPLELSAGVGANRVTCRFPDDRRSFFRMG